MPMQEITKDVYAFYEDRMKKTITNLQENFNAIRTYSTASPWTTTEHSPS